ncbi:MAG: phosphoribosylformylglycinamidine synthase [Bacteroidaceae bacterium]|nr:phosphoribosylformylglycinamidine synthase [Bacteroidaceae bacterium]
MITFFPTSAGSVLAVETDHKFNSEELSALSWLFGGAQQAEADALTGWYAGPRREMVTPWSTNAVEITQNMNLAGISRIEEYFPIDGPEADIDPMLQRRYDGLGQDIFDIPVKPAPIVYVDDLDAYNEQEGLALSREEVDYLHDVERQLGRRLTDSEVFGFAQINSEHCRHKIFGGTFIIDGKEQRSSLFAMIKRTTQKHRGRIVSAYKDNVAFARGPVVEQFAPARHDTSDYFKVRKIKSVISLKAETHNFPTTVEPFNGASTGTGGEIRDRMGGGTGSWPLAGTAVYMTSYPRLEADRRWEQLMDVRQWLYQTPADILIKASNGASDFGNKFGQPLIAGSVLTFEHEENGERYGYDKVIMLAGGIGYGTRRDALKGTPQPGNKVVVVGGDNYRIGLGGGSVSSVETGRYGTGIELNAVQRANPEMQKRAYNLVRALCEEKENPVVSIHDHGSAGHVNCLSELVEECGGKIDMAALPVGDPTLSAKEIIANESQERMGLLIDEKHIDRVRAIAERERAPLHVVGETTGDAHFAFEQADGQRPFDLDVAQMFGHSPKTVMRDVTVERHYKPAAFLQTDIERLLRDVLRLEAVACKDWLTNKVDRSVTGKVAQQQCVGELQLPLADVGVCALDYRGRAGIATALGHAPQTALADPAAGSRLAVAEALTNLVFAPLDGGLDNVSLSANWMWPCRAQEGEDARLYQAVKALSDYCIGLEVNVPTGKDSLSMVQKYPDGTRVISPGTVIVSAGGPVTDVRRVVKPVIAPDADSRLIYIPFTLGRPSLGGTALAQATGHVGDDVPDLDAPGYFNRAFFTVQELINRFDILAGHDVSAGGLVTTLLEMCFANTRGGLDLCGLGVYGINREGPATPILGLFNELPAVVLQVKTDDLEDVTRHLCDKMIPYDILGRPIAERVLRLPGEKGRTELDIDNLRSVWMRTSHLLDRRQSSGGKADERAENFGKHPLRYKTSEAFDGTFASLGADPDRRRRSGTRAAIIREKGTNGEREMAYMLYLAGFDVKDVTMTDLVSGRETLDDVQFIVFCGGFSNSDVLGSAKGWAGAFLYNPKAKAALDRFYARPDTLSLGVCNGCQLMVELGLVGAGIRNEELGIMPTASTNNENTDASSRSPIPNSSLLTPHSKARMLHNDSRKFESAFLQVDVPQNDSVLFGSLSGQSLGIWVAHGEGKFSLPGREEDYNIVLRYPTADYPANPNGSDFNAAAICTPDGRHLAMMPHLERAFLPWQCAYYPAARRAQDCTPWLAAFAAARRWAEAHKV